MPPGGAAGAAPGRMAALHRAPGQGSAHREPGRCSRSQEGPDGQGPTSFPGRQAAWGAGASEPCRSLGSIQSEP
eukprot:761703-Lingulodinium_polyedra.AAC.1